MLNFEYVEKHQFENSYKIIEVDIIIQIIIIFFIVSTYFDNQHVFKKTLQKRLPQNVYAIKYFMILYKKPDIKKKNMS